MPVPHSYTIRIIKTKLCRILDVADAVWLFPFFNLRDEQMGFRISFDYYHRLNTDRVLNGNVLSLWGCCRSLKNNIA